MRGRLRRQQLRGRYGAPKPLMPVVRSCVVPCRSCRFLPKSFLCGSCVVLCVVPVCRSCVPFLWAVPVRLCVVPVSSLRKSLNDSCCCRTESVCDSAVRSERHLCQDWSV